VPNSVLLVVVVLRRNSIDRDDNFESTLSGLTPRGDDGPLSSLSNHDQRGNAFVLDDLFQIGIYRRTPDVLQCVLARRTKSQTSKITARCETEAHWTIVPPHCVTRRIRAADHTAGGDTCAVTQRDRAIRVKGPAPVIGFRIGFIAALTTTATALTFVPSRVRRRCVLRLPPRVYRRSDQ